MGFNLRPCSIVYQAVNLMFYSVFFFIWIHIFFSFLFRTFSSFYGHRIETHKEKCLLPFCYLFRVLSSMCNIYKPKQWKMYQFV
jgi:hypothetical protein